uniref:Transcription factor Pur-alpha 1 n=1 Tax=Lactuca sativa TaxID=4236 RepID=A0A9R1WII5_LACSA|nr:hypothetical protein LSAT_V11C200068260 [Lactuca sativa]
MEFNSGGGGGAGSGGNDVELLSKTLQVEHKLFYFDLKENPRGRYLKISEKTSATRCFTLTLGKTGEVGFSRLLIFKALVKEEVLKSRCNLLLYTNRIFRNMKHESISCVNGVCLQVSEASVSRNRSTIIVPAGSTRDEGWSAFRNILEEINEASKLFVLPNQQNTDAITPERLVGLSDDVGAGFIAGNSSQTTPPASSELTSTFELPPPSSDESGGFGVSKVIRADQKRFFFDLGSNNRGHYLRISEVAGSDRSSIILPLSGLKQFHEMVGHFVEITKDAIEGMTGANVRNVDPPQSQR